MAATGRFEGKATVITGAASGMGRACSLLFANEGAQVLGLDVNEAGLAETAQLVSEAGGKFESGICNVGSRDACFDAIQTAVDTFGKLDILLNVAGIAPLNHMLDVTEEMWNRVISINTGSVFFMSQAAIPHLIESGGNIVNIASNAGVMGQAYSVSYCASKGAVVQLTRSMAMEFMKKPIRINCVCPAGTKTGITANPNLPEDVDFKLMAGFMGMRGLSEAEDIADVIAFVASDAAKSMHGSIINADNGVTAG